MALAEGTLVRWREPDSGAKPLGIVLAVSDDLAQVLMADERANFDLEVFIARREDTGVDAPALVLENMEPAAEEWSPLVAGILRLAAPNWDHLSAHLDGAHQEAPDPDCLMCGGESE
jgi:hypothetical protein